MEKKKINIIEVGPRDGFQSVRGDFIPTELKKEIIDLLERYQVSRCFYGHLHGGSHRLAISGRQGGVDYDMVSADYLSFRPKKILD